MVKTLCMTVLRSCMEINVRHGKQRYCLSVYSKGTDNDKVLTDKNVAELASMFNGVMFPNMEV